MVNKEQAIAARSGDEFHYTGRHDCTRVVGPRGGVKENVVRVRVTGACKTWKTRPTEFRLPVKYGLYESSSIEPWNAADWHRAEDCPLNHRGES